MDKKKKHAEEMKVHRTKWTDEQKNKNREQSKIRMQKYRERKKKETQILEQNQNQDCNNNLKSIETRLHQKKKEDRLRKQRIYKQEWRKNLTAQKKRRIREKDAAMKRAIRIKKDQRATKVSMNFTAQKTETVYQKEALRKAIYRSRKNMPVSPAKYAKVVGGLIKNTTPRRKKALENEGIGSPSAKRNLKELFQSVREAHLDLLKGKTDLQKKRRKEFLSHFSTSLSQKPEFKKIFCMATGIRRKYLSEDYVKPKPKKRRKDATSKQTTDAVKLFFKSEIHSATISDKKSVKKDLQEKHVLMMSQKSLWNKWNIENQTQLSFSKFCELRPKNVLTQGHRKLYQCLCEYCENVKLKLIAINRFLAHDHPELKFTDEFDAVNKTLCPKLEAERFHKRDCIDRKCAECGTSKLRNMFDGVVESEENQPDVKWKRWDIVKTINHKTKKEITKRQEIEKTGPPTDLLEELLDELVFLSPHLFEARWQQEQFAELNKNFPQNSIVLTIDFAENFSCFSQHEIQGAHWAKDSVTIHPCIALYRCPKDGHIVDECIDIVSNDLLHDNHAVHTFLLEVVNHLKQQQKIKIDHAFILSDGCAAQYKSRVPIMDVSCSSEDFGFTVERCFYGSRHGKNRCDGEAGVIKSKASRAIKNSEACIPDARSFLQCVKVLEKGAEKADGACNHNRRTILWFSSDDINRNRPDRNVKTVKGTRKLHSVLGIKRGVINTRRLSCFCSQCREKRYDRCLNTRYVEGWKEVRLKSFNRNIPVNEDEVGNAGDNDVHEDAADDDEDRPILEDADDDDRPILENADDEFDNDNGSPGIPDLQIEDINNISFDPNTSFSYIKDDDSVVQSQKFQVQKKTLYGSSIMKSDTLTGHYRTTNLLSRSVIFPKNCLLLILFFLGPDIVSNLIYRCCFICLYHFVIKVYVDLNVFFRLPKQMAII
ncbi:uncharacterized protein LOC134725403 isoform X1 [Mytilus trossulus]|uniref:uncharacterized protein LOC134725403 isoform X1 n=1 Tax=Mytilus trossulus TaxID=6551 RepID=UPI0030044E91